METPQINCNVKRVACLYRVSTKGQVDNNDIPMQKTACREFIDKQLEWNLVKEYYEMGVSGFKKSAKDRDVLQKVRADASMGLFDILLVFMFDRLGRKDDETPFVVEWFSKQGIEIWSVIEGEQKFDNHTDKLLNYLRYWTSSGESIKTSIRVNESHVQMTKEGSFRGGKPPYGYELVKSGKQNKKNKELHKLSIDENESKTVKEMFRLACEEGYGGKRISTYLNSLKIPSKTESGWRESVVNYILRNPIYKGYMSYGKTSSDGASKNRINSNDWILSATQIPELAIIEEELWDKLQQLRKKRNTMNRKSDNTIHFPIQTKSPLLFVGFIKCGQCGSPLTTTYNNRKWKNKDGAIKTKQRVFYRCSGKSTGKTDCDGQTLHAKNKVEEAVMMEINKYLEQLRQVDLVAQIENFKVKNISQDTLELKRFQKQNEENYKELNILNKEVTKSIMGKSEFKPYQLSNLMEQKENEIKDINSKIIELENKFKDKKIELDDMISLQISIPCWKEEFELASNEQKKMMMSQIIDEIIVYKSKIKIKVKLYIDEFVKSIKSNDFGMQKALNGERKQVPLTTHKIIENLIVVNIKEAG